METRTALKLTKKAKEDLRYKNKELKLEMKRYLSPRKGVAAKSPLSSTRHSKRVSSSHDKENKGKPAKGKKVPLDPPPPPASAPL